MAQIIQTPLTVLHIIACLFLMLVVLVQPGKSGGLGAFTGAAAQQVFGGRGAGNFLTKTTWITATIFFLSSITLAYLSSSSDESLEKKAVAAEKSKPPPTPVPVSAAPSPPPVPVPVPVPEPSEPEEDTPSASASASTAPTAPSAKPAAPKPAAPKPAAPRKPVAPPEPKPAEPAEPAAPPPAEPAPAPGP